ncbi:MAG: DnaJ domain-containing protein [Bacilli bacterium]
MGTITNYFSDCQTIEEIKKRYRKLAQQFHPDHNRETDTNSIMAEINSQYEKFRFQKFTATNHETKKTYEQTFDPFDGYRELIDKLINLQGITIELCGSWLWITGETKQHKETLKELNFSFSGKKIAWYWKPGTYRKKSKKELNLEEIRNLYGSNTVNKQEQEQKKAIA